MKIFPKLLLIVLLSILTGLAVGQERNYHTGPRGGCYYINGSGKKIYVDHSFCHTRAETPSRTNTIKSQPTESNSNKKYIRGPKGGCYYWKGNKKVYVDWALCD